MSDHRKRFAALLLLLCVVGIGTGIVWQRNHKRAKKVTMDLPPVIASVAILADGRVTPERSLNISAAVSGVVEKVFVRDGDSVQAGQLLLRINQTRYLLAVAQAEAQYTKAQAHLDELKRGPLPHEKKAAEIALQTAEMRLARLEEQGPTMEIEVAQAEVEKAQSQLQEMLSGDRSAVLAAATADAQAASVALQQARLNLADTEIRAEFAGTVGNLKVQEGDSVSVGTLFLRLVDTSTWQVETSDLTELSIVKVKVGDRASVTCDAIPELDIPARVVAISPIGESRAGDIVYTVRLKLERQDPRLRWNMTATVKIDPQ